MSGTIGFLGEKRRLNGILNVNLNFSRLHVLVAMTRAKMFLGVVADGETIRRGGKGGFLDKWIQWLEEHSDLRYPDVALYLDSE